MRIDPYYWLRQRDDLEVIRYLEAENAYTDAQMAETGPLQDQLYREMVGRVQETDLSVPVARGDYFYYARTVEGQQYPIYCRKWRSLDAEEEILLDVNAEAEGHGYFRIGAFEVSPDHRMLAFTVDRSGAEDYDLCFKDLTSGSLVPETIFGGCLWIAWASDGKTIFYTKNDEAKRPCTILRHTIGDLGPDPVVYHEADELFRVSVSRTKDDSFLVLASGSIETSEVRVLDAADPSAPPILIEPRSLGLRYWVEHRFGLFYILTNDQAPNFKVVTAAVASPGRDSWQELVGHDAAIMLDGLDMFERYLVLHLRRGGRTAIRVLDIRSMASHEISFDEPAYTVHPGENPDFRAQKLRFVYTSLTTPRSVYDYDLASRHRELRKRQPVLGDFDAKDYVTERLFATSPDGAKVPVSLVYKKGLERNGHHACLLYGYGAYGINSDPVFSSHRLSLLERGMVYAIAHVRGGQEMGRHWYDQGKFLNKQNSFCDFVAAGEALVAGGYTAHERLAIMGGSAGGLLVGAVLNRAPGFCAVAVAKVPFVDVLTTMLDEHLPLTVLEYEEWGNPGDRAYYDAILAYSPYDNLRNGPYPHLLVTAGLNDPRVSYWEPAKWVARLRTVKTGKSDLLLRTHMGAGHGGASGRYDALKERALEYAFILDRLGLNPA